MLLSSFLLPVRCMLTAAADGTYTLEYMDLSKAHVYFSINKRLRMKCAASIKHVRMLGTDDLLTAHGHGTGLAPRVLSSS